MNYNYNMEACFLNKAQIEVLNALSLLKTDEDIYQLKKVITNFFAKRADDAIDNLFDTGVWSDDTLKHFSQSHYRTPYKFTDRIE